MSTPTPPIHWRRLGLQAYEPVWDAMRGFTAERGADTPDELWTLQHPRIFTLGQAGKPVHLLDPADIPVIKCDRGGQVTYHGPGQVVAYVLYDLKRGGIGIKTLVHRLEQAVIDLLARFAIEGALKSGAPGVYVEERKIASLGLRVRHGCTYHGVSLNTAMDLEPFSRINPCGYPGLETTQIRDFHPGIRLETIEQALAEQIAAKLGSRCQPAEATLPHQCSLESASRDAN